METHEADLRDEIQDDAKVQAIQEDYPPGEFGQPTKALLDFANKLT